LEKNRKMKQRTRPFRLSAARGRLNLKADVRVASTHFVKAAQSHFDEAIVTTDFPYQEDYIVGLGRRHGLDSSGRAGILGVGISG
jgi:hypothetical protein